MPRKHATNSELPAARLRVEPWPDPVIDAVGYDPRSAYVERFWLNQLGPSTTWLLRLLATELDRHPTGVDLDLDETAIRLGLANKVGRSSPFARAFTRLTQFDLAQAAGPGRLEVRRHVPPLNLRQVRQLTPTMQAEHRRWQESELRRGGPDREQVRCQRLAATLLELGEDVNATERQLQTWGFGRSLTEEATAWAAGRRPWRASTRSHSVVENATSPPRAPLDQEGAHWSGAVASSHHDVAARSRMGPSLSGPLRLSETSDDLGVDL